MSIVAMYICLYYVDALEKSPPSIVNKKQKVEPTSCGKQSKSLLPCGYILSVSFIIQNNK